MISVVFDPKAREEFIETVLDYEDCQEGLGRQFGTAVENATRNILNAPLMCRIIKAPFRRLILSKFPFAILYTLRTRTYTHYRDCSYQKKARVLVKPNLTGCSPVAHNQIIEGKK